MSFPLLHVTDLVFEEIVNQMELNEIFSLSLCSRYTCDVVKCHLRKSIKYPLYVDAKLENVLSIGFISNDGPVVIMSIEDFDRWDGTRLEEVNIGGCKTRIAKNGNHCVMFHSSIGKMRNGFEMIMDHTKDLFRVEIDSLYCQKPWIVKFIGSRQNAPLRMTYVTETKGNAWNVDGRSVNGHANGLHFESECLPEDFVTTFNVGLDHIRFKKAKCGSFVVLLSVIKSHKEVLFDKENLSSHKISRLYTMWYEGGLSILKFLLIRVWQYDEGITLSGVRELVVNREQATSYKSFSGEVHHFNPGVGLRRPGGTVACIDYDPATRTLRFCSIAGSAVN